MTTKKLNRVNKMSMEGCCPSHSRSSDDASFHSITNGSSTTIPFEIAAIDVRLVVVEVMVEVS